MNRGSPPPSSSFATPRQPSPVSNRGKNPILGHPAPDAAGAKSPAATAGKLPAEIAPEALAALRAPAAALRRKSRAARAAKQSIGALQQQATDHSASVEQALGAGGESNLAAALESAGQVAAQLRRRVQLDDRLDRMTRHRADLEEQSHELLERQILPGWILASLGGVFILGVLMLLAGLFLPTKIIGSFGWTIAVLGVLAFGTASTAKWLLEKAAARQLESCRKQLALLESQTKQALQERDTLDQQLPEGNGNLIIRLKEAESHLAQLEDLVPLEARARPPVKRPNRPKRPPPRPATNSRRRTAAGAKRWPRPACPRISIRNKSANACAAVGRPAIRTANCAAARDERDRRRRELAAFAARIEPLYLDAELLPDASSPSEQLRHLRRQVAEQETLVGRRDELRRRLRKLRRTKRKYSRALGRCQRRRLSLLHSCGVTDEAEFLRRAAEHGQIDQLHRRREALDREVLAACAGVYSETDLAALLGPSAREQLPRHRSRIAEQLHAARRVLERLFEQRGQLNEQLRALADDRGIGRRQLELGLVEERLKEAVARWQVLATTRTILESIKHDYERNRQPETLRAASEHLLRLTRGRYTRVWTPLGEERLCVDDAAGAALPIEVLSRGTREQLFLSLRMALVAGYARRGAAMPLVLDDVLVNFDLDRPAPRPASCWISPKPAISFSSSLAMNIWPRCSHCSGSGCSGCPATPIRRRFRNSTRRRSSSGRRQSSLRRLSSRR